jgi:tetratricopeptide (TPR) repeat protein
MKTRNFWSWLLISGLAFSVALVPVKAIANDRFGELFLLAHYEFAGTSPEKAIATLEEAIRIAPDQASKMLAETFLFGIARTYGVSIKEADPQKAIALFNKAIALRPDDPFPVMHRGYTFCHLKQYNSCISDMTRSIEVASSEEKARYFGSRATAYTMIGQIDKAVADHNSAIRIYRLQGDLRGAEIQQGLLNILQGNVPLK